MTVSTAERRPVQLSTHELTILSLLGEGLTQDSVARRLDISVRTLRRHLRGVCVQLRVKEPIEAVAWAARQGLL